MLEQLTNRFKKYKKIVGIEMLIKPDQHYVYNVIILEKKKDKIEILARHTALESLDAVHSIEAISSLPIALVLNGKSVLSKKVNATNLADQKLISSVIPNANPEDFSYQIHTGQTATWVSIIRKELLETIINTFSTKGLSIIDVSLGVLGAQHILPLITPQSSIQTTAYILNIKEQEVTGFSSKKDNDTTQKYNIGDDELDDQLILAFSKAFSKLINIPETLHHVELIQQEEEKYIYSHLFQKLKWGGLVGIFGLLLINFMIFNYLNNKNQQTGVQLSMHQSQLNQLNNLKSRYQEKQAFFKQTSVLKPSKTSWYADQIASSMQEGIQLQQLEIAPSINKKKRRIDQQYLFNHQKLLIKGKSKRSNFLNNWINDLQNLDWIKTVNVLPYSEEKNGRGAFELEVVLK